MCAYVVRMFWFCFRVFCLVGFGDLEICRVQDVIVAFSDWLVWDTL